MKVDSAVWFIGLSVALVLHAAIAFSSDSGQIDSLTESDYQEIFTKAHLQHNPEYYVTIDQAMKKFKADQAFLVDLRSQSDYSQFHIPGSLNIPLGGYPLHWPKS